jgi:hypothetical protein
MNEKVAPESNNTRASCESTVRVPETTSGRPREEEVGMV